ncbi:MAG: TIGR02302 family protein [Rhodomicrobiaceae bacterium]
MKWTSDRPQSRGPSRYSSAPQLDKKVRRTRLVLILERLWPTLWLPAGVIGVFLLFSLFGFWQQLTFEIHRGILWGFTAALALSFIPLIRMRWPSDEEALRRLEATAGLPHRPASSYHDTLAGDAPSQVMQRIWAAHRERMTRLFSRLRSGWPHPRIDRWDPFALRVLLVLLLAVGYIANRDDALDRIKAAFVLKPSLSLSSARLDAWITPPVYTAQPPIMVADGSRHMVDGGEAQNSFTVPVNSELTVRVNHANAAQFSIRIVADDDKTTDVPPAASDAGKLVTASLANTRSSTAEFKQKLTAASTIELLEDGSPVARWTVDVIQDSPPRITLTEPPSEAQRGSLRFKYSVEDDYGVLSAQALIERADNEDWSPQEQRPADGKRLGEPPTIPLSLPRANTKKGEGQTYRDLTSHFWAGLPVTVTLEARDQAGQTGRSEAYEFTLPERSFHNPLAKALIEQRKKLVDRPDLKGRVARALDALTIAPELFIQDKSIYLGIRSAYWRITGNTDIPSLESAANLLWQIAVHIEDGNLSDAERRLRSAQEDLMRALEQGASDEELKRLMNELRTALNEFLENLRQQAQQNPEFDPNSQFSSDRVVTSQDLERMLKRIEDLAKTGARDAARQMLSELRDLLENARPGNQAGNRQAQEMMQALDGLSDLISKQQQLLDETYRSQQGEPGQMDQDSQQGQGQQGQGQEGQGQQGKGQQGKGQQGQGQQGQNSPFPGLQQRQGNLQGQLKQLLDKLRSMGAQPPDQFDGAGQAMGKAGDALGQAKPGQATEQQTLALDKLRQGAKSLAEQMMRGRGQAGRMGRAPGGNGDRDPLGRPLPTQGLDDGDSVKVPEEADVQRARQILEELRKRLGERQRPPSELDYIERLIDRF